MNIYDLGKRWEAYLYHSCPGFGMVKRAVSCVHSGWGKKSFVRASFQPMTQLRPLPAAELSTRYPLGLICAAITGHFYVFSWVVQDVTKGKSWAVVYLLLEMMHGVERRQIFFSWLRLNLQAGSWNKNIFVCKISEFPLDVSGGK